MALTVDVVLAGIKEIVVEVAGIDAGIIAMDKKLSLIHISEPTRPY